MEQILETFIDQMLQTTGLEAIAVVFGLLSVWYSKQENIWVYPTGIISVSIAVYLTYINKLYAESGVNVYYFVMSVYGWYHWLDPKSTTKQIPITINSGKENLLSLGLFTFSFLIIRFGLDFTDSDVPNLDAITTASAITGMWLMARKKLENWIAWIFTDIIATPLYYYKGLPWFSFQFFIFTILATWGFFEWRKRIREHEIIEHKTAHEN